MQGNGVKCYLPAGFIAIVVNPVEKLIVWVTMTKLYMQLAFILREIVCTIFFNCNKKICTIINTII